MIAWLAGAVLAVVMTWPMMSAPGQLTRMDTHDGKFSVWNVAWVAHALISDPANVFNANIFHPQKGTLAYSEANLVAGVMAAPVYALTGNPIAAHNVVVYVSPGARVCPDVAPRASSYRFGLGGIATGRGVCVLGVRFRAYRAHSAAVGVCGAARAHRLALV